MRYISVTPRQRQQMLSALRLQSVEDLFEDIPDEVRLKRPLNLPEGIFEAELSAHVYDLSKKNRSTNDLVSFAGAGCYDHYVPSVVDHVIRKPEFFTAYTPYQPEVSQGTLQALYEYQSMICSLTGMEIANASMYDGATAFVEAAFMACRITRRKTVLCASNIHPEWRSTLLTYAHAGVFDVVDIPIEPCTSRIERESLAATLSTVDCPDVAAVMLQSPNFFGVLEDIEAASAFAHGTGALLVVASNPILLGLMEPPSKFGADIVVGEGQPLGSPISFGGPGFGFFSCRSNYVRQVPGRIVGRSIDADGADAFVLTFSTREQHIRREKATSNICSNHSLNAVAAGVYLASMGGTGLRAVARACVLNAHQLRSMLLDTGKFEALWDTPFGYEFALRYSAGSADNMISAMLDRGFLAGVGCRALLQSERHAPNLPLDLDDVVIFAVTEKRTSQQIIDFVEAVNAL